LRFDRENVTYLAGEEVSGALYINTSRPVTLSRIGIKLTGVIHTGWTNKTSDVVYESNEEILHEFLDASSYLSEISDGELLPEGEHSIRFNFKLSMDVVSSMHNDYFGWVRYTCTGLLGISDSSCFIRLSGNNELVVEKPIIVYSMLNLDAPHFRTPSTAADSVELVGCCRRHGALSAKMTISEQGILPGETTKITITIENGSRKRKKERCPVIALCQQLDFKAQNIYVMDLFDRKALTLVVESIGTCQAIPGAGPQVKLIEFTIPSGLPPTSTKANGLITVSYFFKLDMEDFELVIPVVLGTFKTLSASHSGNSKCH